MEPQSSVSISDSDPKRLYTEYGCREFKVEVNRLDFTKLQKNRKQGWYKLDESSASTVRTPRNRRPKQYLGFEMTPPVISRLKNKENGMVLLHRATYNKNPGKCVMPRSHSVASPTKKTSQREKIVTEGNTTVPIKTNDAVIAVEKDDNETVRESCEKTISGKSGLLETPASSNDKENNFKEEIDISVKAEIKTEENKLIDNEDKSKNKPLEIPSLETVTKRRSSLPEQLKTTTAENVLSVTCKKPLRSKSESLSREIKVNDTILKQNMEQRERRLQSLKMSVSSDAINSSNNLQELLKSPDSLKRNLTISENLEIKNDMECNVPESAIKYHKKSKLTIDKNVIGRNKLDGKKTEDSVSDKHLSNNAMLNNTRKLRNDKKLTLQQRKHFESRSLQVNSRSLFANGKQSSRRVKAQIISDKLQKQGGKNKEMNKNAQNVKRVLRRRIENVQNSERVQEKDLKNKLDGRKRKNTIAQSEVIKNKKLREAETNTKMLSGTAQKRENSTTKKIDSPLKNTVANVRKRGRPKSKIVLSTKKALQSEIEDNKKCNTESLIKKAKLGEGKKNNLKHKVMSVKKSMFMKRTGSSRKMLSDETTEAEQSVSRLKNFDDVEAALAKIVNGTCDYFEKNLEELYTKIDPSKFPSNLWKAETKPKDAKRGEIGVLPKGQRKSALGSREVWDARSQQTSSLSEVVVKRCPEGDGAVHDRLVCVKNNLNFYIKIENDVVSLLGAPNVISDIEDLYVLLQIVDETTLNSFNIDK